MKKYILVWLAVLFLMVGCNNLVQPEYKLILNLNDGSDNPKIIQKFDEPQDVDLFIPTREGYEFEGWAYKDTIIYDSSIYVNRVITLKAKWNPKKYTVTLIDELNGYREQIIINNGDALNLTPRECLGYKFLGWYKDDELIESGSFDYFEDITLNAKYEKEQYKATYYIDGEIYDEITISYQDNWVHPKANKPGYRFLGWYYNDNKINTEKYIYNIDIQLTAKFEQETYIINFIDGNKEVLTPIYVKYLEYLKLPTITKFGYKFLGWYDGEQKIDDGKYQGTYSMTLYAKWAPNTYYIKFMSDGLEALDPLEVKYNEKFNLPTITKSGYTFLGWCYDGDLLEDGKYTYTHDITVTASWKSGITKNFLGTINITLFNMERNPYNEVSMYDSTTTIMASLYWHKYGIIKENDCYKVSFIGSPSERLQELGKFDYVILAFNDYPEYNSFVNIGLNVGDIIEFSQDPSQLEKGEVNVSVSCYNTIYPDPDKAEFVDYLSGLYGNYTYVNSDIDLVQSYRGYKITWKTSNKNVINTNGEYTRPVVSRKVTLTAVINNKDVYSFEVDVDGDKNKSEALTTGYFYTRFSDTTEETFQNLDIAYISFAYVNSSGEFINMSESSSFIKNILANIVPKARKAGTKIIISINQDANQFSTIAGSESLRKTFATNIVKMLNKYGFDGVDIDWETPKSSEATNFTLMMKEIYHAVKANNLNHLVTAAIGGGKWQPPRYDLSNSTKYLDYINLMTYSMVSNGGKFHNALYKSSKGYTLSSCSIEESIEIYDSYNVPRNKILVGLAFYGIKQTGSKGVGTSCSSSSSYTYRGIYQDYLSNPREGVEICFDEETASPYIYDALNEVFISYENELSIAAKCDYVNTLGLAGVMYWQDGHDNGDTLLDAIKLNIRK